MPSPSYESRDRVRDLFDRIAPEYDRLNTLLSLGLHRVWKSMAVKWTEPELGDDALDICCGSGDLGLLMARAVGPSGHVTGIDISENLLAIARCRAKLALREQSTSWLCGDALQLPFEGDRFDAVTMGYGLRNVVDIPQALREIWRVLKPGAKAAILDFPASGERWESHAGRALSGSLFKANCGACCVCARSQAGIRIYPSELACVSH